MARKFELFALYQVSATYFHFFRDSRGLEREAIREAEAGNLRASLLFLNQAISLTPNRASCYNNRHELSPMSSPANTQNTQFIIKYTSLSYSPLHIGVHAQNLGVGEEGK